MGIFAEEIVTTDTLGRRTGPRMRHTIEEKLRIVQETRVRVPRWRPQPVIITSTPIRVCAWRQLYRRELLIPQAAKGDATDEQT